MKKTMLTLSFIAAAYILKAQVLYGTTAGGGNNNGGAICKLAAATNTLTAAFSFDPIDGVLPENVKLLQASDGKLYGMTRGGGDRGNGTIFSYDPAALVYAQLKSFDGANASDPYGSFVQASDGKLYGMTSSGGSSNVGVIFSYDPATSAYTKLKDFNGKDGAFPNGSLVQASDGKLYGMTNEGGSSNYGVIFSYDAATSTYTKLKDFNGKNGAYPYGSLIQASDGKLYGMTSGGGGGYSGIIFSYDPFTSIYTKLVDCDYVIGADPHGSLIQASDGKLYGMTSAGGSNNDGVIFSYNLATSTYTKLIDFDNINGAYPYGDLAEASDGKLYGMTYYGGSAFYGVMFSYDPAGSVYTKLIDFNNTNGKYPFGSLVEASDRKLYGMTNQGGNTGYGVLFSYDLAAVTYTKLRDFKTNNTGNSIQGPLIKDQAKKMYGMTPEGGSYGAGTIFSYDVNTSVFTKLKDFDYINGASPTGSLVQASDEKIYGMTPFGGINGAGVLFSYDPADSTYIKLKDFDDKNGSYPYAGLMQASDGKLYGTTSYGGNNNGYGTIFSYDAVTSTYTTLVVFNGTNGGEPSCNLIHASDGKLYGMTNIGGRNDFGVIFSYDPTTSVYSKLKDFDGTNGSSPYGSLVLASDGKLYGMTYNGGGNDSGVIFSYDPATSVYTKLKDFDRASGYHPFGSLVQASDGKLYGMTDAGGSSGYGVAFSYDPAASTYTKLSDFNGDNGSYPAYTAFTEIPAGEVKISIADKTAIEGDRDRKFIFVSVVLSEKPLKKIIRVNYTTQNNTAKAGCDYTAQSGTLVFLPGIKKIILPIRILGDETPEPDETFSIILSNPVNATIADSTGIVTILNDDASTLNAAQQALKTIPAINLSPNPAQDKVKIMLTGYSGNVVIQLSSIDGRILQQQKLQAFSAKSAQQQINVGSYANGTYLITAIDEKGNRQTEKLVIDR